ncbi:putative defensin-like protein 180 [Eutrema salsugineum]|uniref:putative defensin-like protein 180 n=1 Tax=Eutrema salsugineum TaxID=72664 RepID=UPI000CED1823|nr:putative defensin-like protein 180 [Eutrema salsugineum]
MQRITSLLFLVSLFIMFTSVVNQSRTDTCSETLGPCENCDQKCLAKYGPSVQTHCIGPGGGLCTCVFHCRPSIPLKVCPGAMGLCTDTCSSKCCNWNCSKKYYAGRGSCLLLGDFNVCQCEYTC